MTLDEVVAHFGTMYQVAKQLGISYDTPRNWKRIGFIPADMQVKIHRYTDGKLQFSMEHLGEF